MKKKNYIETGLLLDFRGAEYLSVPPVIRTLALDNICWGKVALKVTCQHGDERQRAVFRQAPVPGVGQQVAL